MRRDLDHLEHVRDKLNNALEKVKSQLEEANKKIKMLTLKSETQEKENLELKRLRFDHDVKAAKAEQAIREFAKHNMIVEQKLKRLAMCERDLEAVKA
jgi:hypothetical protein